MMSTRTEWLIGATASDSGCDTSTLHGYPGTGQTAAIVSRFDNGSKYSTLPCDAEEARRVMFASEIVAPTYPGSAVTMTRPWESMRLATPVPFTRDPVATGDAFRKEISA